MTKFLTLIACGLPFYLATPADGSVSAWRLHTLRSSQVHTTAHGVKLELSAARRAYPRDSLASMTVRVENLTRRAILLQSQPNYCRYDNPGVDVVSGAGKTVYPPALVPFPAMPCPPAAGVYSLRPGAALRRSEYVILRASRLLGRVALREGASPAGSPVEVTTPPLMIQLAAGGALALAPRASGGRIYAVFRRPKGAVGPLRYQAWDACPPGAALTVRSSIRWMRTLASRVSPDCALPSEWHVVAGWVNFPVRTVDYVRH